MKEFTLVVKCRTAAELMNALEEAVTEVRSNAEQINGFEVDEEWDITAGAAEQILLLRVE